MREGEGSSRTLFGPSIWQNWQAHQKREDSRMESNQWEGAAHMRLQLWEDEVQRHKLAAHVAPTPKQWQQWTGRGMLWLGGWLSRTGEGLIRRACPECVPASS